MTNLLVNPSFENGYYHANNVPELAIPNGWLFAYEDAKSPRLPRQDADFFRPEVVTWNKKDAPSYEKDLFFRHGDFILKVFKGWGPIWFDLWQEVNLEVGHTYRFSIDIFPDLVKEYREGQKVWADDILAGEHLLTHDSTSVGTGWLDGKYIHFGQWNTLQYDFSPAHEKSHVGISVRGRWGLQNNGWFFDNVTLTDLESPVLPDVTPTIDIQQLQSLINSNQSSLEAMNFHIQKLLDNNQKIKTMFKDVV
jgi:hypothetical protein